MEREALNLVLEVLENLPGFRADIDNAKDVIKAALAQPEQEPVATVQCIHGITIGYLEIMQPVGTKLYTAPPQRPWVGLTDDELADLSASGLSLWALWRAIEAKLKERNA